MSAAVEFPRPIRLDRIGDAPREEAIEATAEERAALARRFRLVALDRLAARATLRREAATVLVDGRLEAEVVQACVASGEPLPARVTEPFSLRFVPAGEMDDEEVELDEDDLDTLTYEGGAIDLGEAVAQTLSLALDPFPRAADADRRLREAGVKDAGEVGAFAGLAALRNKPD